LILKALDIRRSQLGERHESVAQSYNDLGEVYQAQGNSAAAEAQYRQALTLLPADHAGRGAITANLGRLCEARGEWGRAAQLYQQALTLRRARLGNQHDLVAETLQRLGVVQRAQGLHRQGDANLREALAILQSHFEPTHPKLVELSRLLQHTTTDQPPPTVKATAP
jgi:tetratricopeptide (TPR) repeat protein